MFLFSAELKLNYLKRPYFVTMGTFHMAIMLLFNQSEKLPFREILMNTEMPEKELMKQLQGLLETKMITTTVSRTS